MSPHPPLTERLAVKPAVVAFTLDTLVVRCPQCRTQRTYRLACERPRSDACCPHCGHPWRWD